MNFNGEGYIFLDWMLAILGALACLLNIAVLRAPDIMESDLESALRRMKIIALLLINSRHWYLLADAGDILISPPILFGMLLLYTGMSLKCLYALLYPKILESDLNEVRRNRHRAAEELARCDKIIAKAEGHSMDRRVADRRAS